MRSKQIKWVAAWAGIALLFSAATAGAAQGQNDAADQAQASRLSSKDHDFLVQAARINMEEVEVGQLAQKKGDSQAVCNFGEHMINDHSKVNAGLKEIAAQKDAKVPAQLAQEQSATLQTLEGLSGADFDRTFANDMVKGHTDAVKLFEDAAKDLSDSDLRAWAQTTLPLLQEHLRMAKNMETAVQNEK